MPKLPKNLRKLINPFGEEGASTVSPEQVSASSNLDASVTTSSSTALGDSRPSVPESISRLPAIQEGPNFGMKILYEPSEGIESTADIVFVHGLTGNSYKTWSFEENGVHWPSMLLKEDIRNVRILAFGYDADVVHWWHQVSQNRLSSHAEALVGALERHRRGKSKDKKVIFVAHSLGGLVVEDALRLSRYSPDAHLHNIESFTFAIAFMGTPHFGSDLADWGALATNISLLLKRTNKDIVDVLRPGSEVLASVQKSFQAILRMRMGESKPISITCFFEELPTSHYGEVGGLQLG